MPGDETCQPEFMGLIAAIGEFAIGEFIMGEFIMDELIGDEAVIIDGETDCDTDGE